MMTAFINLIFTFINRFKKKQQNVINKILFIRFDNKIGDTVVESFFLRELKKINFNLQLDVIMFAPYDRIIKNNPNINSIYSVDSKNKWKKLFSFIPFLRKQKYDLIIDIPARTTLKRLLFMCSINSQNIMSTNTDYKFLKYTFEWEKNTHFSNVFVKALSMLGVKNIDTKYEIFISQEDKDYANNFIIQNKLINKKIFVFNPQGSTLTRSLNKENIKKILIKLQKYKYSIVLLDYKKQYDEFKNLAILYTSNNIMQVAALIEKSNYVLTTDTGIVHVSDIYLKPMTVLYSDVFKEGEKPRDDSYIIEWHSINPQTKMLRDKYNVNNINIDSIIDVLDREII